MIDPSDPSAAPQLTESERARRDVVRCGLAERPDLRLNEALDGFEAALAELRAAACRVAGE